MSSTGRLAFCVVLLSVQTATLTVLFIYWNVLISVYISKFLRQLFMTTVSFAKNLWRSASCEVSFNFIIFEFSQKYNELIVFGKEILMRITEAL